MKRIYVTGASGVPGPEIALHFNDKSEFDVAWPDPVDTDATVRYCADLSDPRQNLRIRETDPTTPARPDGLHKLGLERTFAQPAEKRGFELVILRVSIPWGAKVRKPDQGAIPILKNAFLNDPTFRIVPDGTAERHYIDIFGLCAAAETAVRLDLLERNDVHHKRS